MSIAGREILADSVAARLEQQLFSMLAAGRIAGGERLPSVRDLTRQFGVSRTTVQSAIRGLAARGLVRSTPRQGTVVLPREPNPVTTCPQRKTIQVGVIDLLSSVRYEDEDAGSWYQGVIRAAEHVLAWADYQLLKVAYLKQENSVDQEGLAADRRDAGRPCRRDPVRGRRDR
jgi:DNA-binding transcriptional regulator YhcF (GntR family)